MKVNPYINLLAAQISSTDSRRVDAPVRPQGKPALQEQAPARKAERPETPASARISKTPAAAEGAGRREAPGTQPALRQPGSLVDIRV